MGPSHVEPLVLAVSEQLALSHPKNELCAVRRGKMECESDPFRSLCGDEEVIRDQIVGEAVATCKT